MASRKTVTVAVRHQPIMYKGNRIAPFRIIDLPAETAEGYLRTGAVVSDIGAAGLVEVTVTNDGALSLNGWGREMAHYRGGWRVAIDPERAWYLQQSGEIVTDAKLKSPRKAEELPPPPVGLAALTADMLRSEIEAYERELDGFERTAHNAGAASCREQIRIRREHLEARA